MATAVGTGDRRNSRAATLPNLLLLRILADVMYVFFPRRLCKHLADKKSTADFVQPLLGFVV